MTTKDETRFRAAITALAEAYRQTITPATLHAYLLGLDDLSIDAIEGAVRKALRTCRFMPAPIELRELSGEVAGGNRAVMAWDCFSRAVVEHGGYKSVVFDDPVLNATVRNLGGWQRCCELPAEEFDKWLRKDFLGAYQSLAAAGAGSTDMLPGIFARENAITGKHHEPSERMVVVQTGLPGSVAIEDLRQRQPPQIGFSDGIGRPEGT